ncbi:DUF1367 family protein [Variovorax ginsengisoli]|uniref:DUF1367 family protein n=1 Tax=Variovorax ginsengisoli TaxID=363844 RepID=A0ABT8RZ47_9BURK|nr:DUF1367 family protein [Variovorax ginsengisoli]MDN8612769.1 DUF1367 family protein [Variovorax ginsengisoli]MDO1531939.1 DUF1367 family protein [Variovorax ginsengisoli]
MSDITLVRQQPVQLTAEERAVLTRCIFGIVDGLGERGRKQWRRLWSNILRLEPGEMLEIKTHQQRIGWYHRKHMALEQTLFESQDRFEVFEGFRDWLKVGAGFCDWYPGPKGGVFPVPKSISYTKLEQGEMEKFHNDAIEFLRTEHAGKTLWKHLTVTGRIEMLETILASFGEW